MPFDPPPPPPASGPTAQRLLIVDDDGDLRQLVARTLRGHPVLDVVGEAPDGATALELCELLRPGIVLLDLGLPDITGQDLLGRLRQRAPWLRVVVYTGSDMSRATVRKWGAAGLIRKDQSLTRLVGVLERVADEPLSVSVELPPSTAVIAEARRFVEATLQDWECGALIADAQLAVSELVTNAVLHAQTTSQLRLALSSGLLRIEVSDLGAGSPEPQAPSLSRPGGRGLMIVSALASAWGIDPIDGGKVVWAELVS
jgi:CheY-like chemotaxis protein